MKQEKIREKQLAEQREARRQKNVVRKEKRINKKLEQLGGVAKKAPTDQKEAAQPAKKDEPVAKDVKGKSPTKAEKQQPKAAPEKAAPKQQTEAKGKSDAQAKQQPKGQPKKGGDQPKKK